MTEQGWKLNREGYVNAWLVSGPRAEEYTSEARDANQLRYEATLRKGIARHLPVDAGAAIRAGENGRLGMPWRPVMGRDLSFLNLSDFYSLMRRVTFDAATVIFSPEERSVSAVLWSYAAVDLYLNGEKLGGIEAPVYKPIHRQEISLPLRAGRNLIYLACETLGVRDTRSVVGLQMLDGREVLRAALPDEACGAICGPVMAFLEGAELIGAELVFHRAAPEGTAIFYPRWAEDIAEAEIPPERVDVSGRYTFSAEAEKEMIRLEVNTPWGTLGRTFEITERIQPQMRTPVPSRAENEKIIYQRIADIEVMNRGNGIGFPIVNLLARKALGMTHPRDEYWMREMLRLIDSRVDCADFQICGLIRYLKNYPVDAETAAEIRRVLLNFRYWMDMDGFDGMCFWSENHALLFYSCMMLAGQMYPEETFPRAGMTGREMAEKGRRMTLAWIEDVEEYGFEEFLSTVYMCITFMALLNLVDYGDAEISARAWMLTDQLMTELASHVYKGGIVAPMGRVYRGVLYPFRQGAMAMMNWLRPDLPWDLGEGWLSILATTKYRPPEGLECRMEEPLFLRYRTGNAEIVLDKREDWCLTSVASPAEGSRRWENILLREGAEENSPAFTKSFNERFHGTTWFQPGTYGYQQHMWYAALDSEACIFVNHPGSSSEGGDMRPGYWHGNGVMPALTQRENTLGMIWRIPEAFPLHYVHLYAPVCRFEEGDSEGNWFFLRKGKGYIGFWSSVPQESWAGMNTDCEWRMYGDEIACLVVMGGREYESLRMFEEACRELRPRMEGDTLFWGADRLIWRPGDDETQYL